MESLIPILREFGVPMVVLAALALAIWHSCRWLAAEVVRPLTAAHIRFLDAIQTSVTTQTETLAQMSETQQQQTSLLESINDSVKEHNDLLREHHQFAIGAVDRIQAGGQHA